MNTAQVNEFRELLAQRCPDYAGIDVVHLGKFRVQIDAVSPDAYPVHFVMSLSHEDAPMGWAVDAAKVLNRMLVIA